MAIVLVALTFSRPARAAEPAALRYEASATCPDRTTFLRELHARTARWSESPVATRTFVIQLTDDGAAHARGSLVIEHGERRGVPRVIEAKSCVEAVRALSFVVALAIDPDAKPPTTESADAPPEETTTAPTPEARAPTEARSTTGDPVAGSTRPVPSADRRRGTTMPMWWRIGASVEAVGLAAPGAVFGGGLVVGVRPMPWLDVRLSAHQTLPTEVETPATSTTFSWTTGRIEPCLELFQTGALEGGPCAFAEVGRTVGRGGGVARLETATHVWSALGPSVHAQWTGAAPFVLEGGLGAAFPLDRTDFAYRTGPTVYRPPLVGVVGVFGVSVRWH